MNLQQTYGYVRDPAEIYRQSFAAIEAAADVSHLPTDIRTVALRLAHAAGDATVLDALRWSDGAGAAGRAALAGGAALLADTRMTADGIIRRNLPADNAVICTLTLGSVAGLAARADTTRSAAAVELWTPWLAGSVVAIGNAPTALFRLLEGIASGWPRPALTIGMPVGYVGAAESKAALADSGLAHITLTGRTGGSALAAAAANALATNPEMAA